MRLPSTIAVLATLLSVASAHAADVPATVGKVTFSGFYSADGPPLGAACDRALAGSGSVSCLGTAVYFNGPLGDGPHVTGSVSGHGVISGGASPTATTTLNFSGGDEFTGGFAASVTTELQYYVTVVPIGAIGTAGLKIPMGFADAGSIRGEAGTAKFVSGRAATFLHAFTGSLIVDGDGSSIFDAVSDIVDEGSLSQSYGGGHSVVLDFTEGATIAEIDLSARCSYGSTDVGFGAGSCTASADPFFGFDQAAFDIEMGANTFNLADAFRVEVSPGLGPAGGGGVPEPAAWMLMIAGFGLAGAALRRRRAYA